MRPMKPLAICANPARRPEMQRENRGILQEFTLIPGHSRHPPPKALRSHAATSEFPRRMTFSPRRTQRPLRGGDFGLASFLCGIPAQINLTVGTPTAMPMPLPTTVTFGFSFADLHERKWRERKRKLGRRRRWRRGVIIVAVSIGSLREIPMLPGPAPAASSVPAMKTAASPAAAMMPIKHSRHYRVPFSLELPGPSKTRRVARWARRRVQPRRCLL